MIKLYNFSFSDQLWKLDACKLRNKANVRYSDDFFLTTPNTGELVRKTRKKQSYLFTFLLLDPSQFWNLNADGNLANKKTLELLTDSDGNEINISNFKFSGDDKVNYIENSEGLVLEAGYDDKVKLNTKDTENSRQLWKKGCPNFEGYFMIEHSASQMLLTVTNDSITDTKYSLVMIGLFKAIYFIGIYVTSDAKKRIHICYCIQ